MRNKFFLAAAMLLLAGASATAQTTGPQEEMQRFDHPVLSSVLFRSWLEQKQVKWIGVVHYFYCSVDDQQNRGIAVATSKDLGKSTLSYPEK